MHKLIMALALAGCATEEAARVALPVATSAAAMPAATTDLGYQVQIAQLRVAISTVQFTIEGESHPEDAAQGGAYLLPPAPHPGHSGSLPNCSGFRKTHRPAVMVKTASIIHSARDARPRDRRRSVKNRRPSPCTWRNG